jgi:hypothetical protein
LAWFGKSRRLAYVIASASAATLLLTGLVVVVNWAPLNLLFPWRLSVALIPIATLGLVARSVELIHRGVAACGLAKLLALSGPTIAATVLIGTSAIILTGQARPGRDESPEYRDPGYQALVRVVRTDPDPDAIYLHPPRLFQSFRLQTGHPVVVDMKSHPFKDIDILAWWTRVNWADRFFAGDACRNEQPPYRFDRIVLPWKPNSADVLINVQSDLVRRCLVSSGNWRVMASVPGYDILEKDS